MYYLLSCRSLTYAQRAVKALVSSGITAFVSKLPQSVSLEGCGYCTKVPERYLLDALPVLKDYNLYPIKVYALHEDGSCLEVDV